MKDGRENLVLVNSFYTNSAILQGLIDFLNDTFNVYFIDLPGFSADIPPLDDINVESFAHYVRRRIDGFGLDHFVLGGISFGFLVANRVPLNGGCRGIVGITPYLDRRSLKLRPVKRHGYRLVTGFFSTTRLSRRIWKTRAVRRFARYYSRYPSSRVDLILEHMDGQTFFETGRMILSGRHACPFHDLPYVLIVNRDDTTIDFEYTTRRFRDNAANLLIVETKIDHYPQEISKEYFRERIGCDEIDRIAAFLRYHRRA
jgi:pimeloyl-ACP methyl ester carboxylesterase